MATPDSGKPKRRLRAEAIIFPVMSIIVAAVAGFTSWKGPLWA